MAKRSLGVIVQAAKAAVVYVVDLMECMVVSPNGGYPKWMVYGFCHPKNGFALKKKIGGLMMVNDD